MGGRILRALLGALLTAGVARAETCVECHQAVEEPAGWAHTYADWADSLHAAMGVTCHSCHGGDDEAAEAAEAHAGMTPVGGGRTPKTRLLAAKVCGSCHWDKYRAFATSAHYRSLVEGRMAAYCHTCHTSVGSRVLTAATVAATCRRCHPKGGRGRVAARARAILACLDRVRVAATFRDTAAHLTPEQWRALRASATEAMDHWHAFDLDAVERALDRGRALVEAAGRR